MKEYPGNRDRDNLIVAKFNDAKLLPFHFNGQVKGVIIVLLAIAVMSSFISYTLVLSRENDLIKLHEETSTTQMENNDIAIRVESTKSLYNVEGKALSLEYLHKPDKIIEVGSHKDNLKNDVLMSRKVLKEKIARGY